MGGADTVKLPYSPDVSKTFQYLGSKVTGLSLSGILQYDHKFYADIAEHISMSSFFQISCNQGKKLFTVIIAK